MPMASMAKAVVADGVITFIWVFCASTLGTITSIVTSYLGVQAHIYANVLVTTSLVVLLIVFFDVVGSVLGGASFNPTGTASFYAAGVGNDDILSLALRLPQALGAVGGVLAIMKYMPEEYKHMLEGPSLKVDLHTRALAEGILTFFLCLVVLWIITRGPRNYIVKTLLIALGTMVVVVAGSGYTGPSLNPANAFGWAYVNNNHNTWDQYYVYWICPFIGSILAAWVFRFIFSPKVNKVKKA